MIWISGSLFCLILNGAAAMMGAADPALLLLLPFAVRMCWRSATESLRWSWSVYAVLDIISSCFIPLNAAICPTTDDPGSTTILAGKGSTASVPGMAASLLLFPRLSMLADLQMLR